jgi:hypothetical protein
MLVAAQGLTDHELQLLINTGRFKSSTPPPPPPPVLQLHRPFRLRRLLFPTGNYLYVSPLDRHAHLGSGGAGRFKSRPLLKPDPETHKFNIDDVELQQQPLSHDAFVAKFKKRILGSGTKLTPSAIFRALDSNNDQVAH